MRLPIHAARVFNTPLMIDPGKANTILRAAGHKFVPGGVMVQNFVNVNAGTVGDEIGNAYEKSNVGHRLAPLVFDGVAKINIEGTLVHKGKWIGMDSGETSYEGLQAQIGRAMRDDGIKGVIFEVDSHGGEVSGAFETAEMMAELSAKKPTMAILTDVALSAGYLLGCCARQIVAPATGWAGSIGVVAMHVDYSKAMADEGIKVTMIYSGDHKVDGNAFEPLPEDVQKDMKAELDRLRDMFATHVGSMRGKRMNKEQAMKTEARVFNPQDALALGLIDAIASPGKAAAMFAQAIA